jgi:NhaP-type Na+/H+ and K+/H+ antiporter
MTLNRKSIPFFLGFSLIGLLIGSLTWEIIERIFQQSGISLTLTLSNPLLIDFHVIALSLRPNIGSLAGFLGGIILFFII